MILSTALIKCNKYHVLAGHTAKTIAGYNGALKKFQNFTGDIDLSDLNIELIENYTLSLYEQERPKLAITTIRSYMVHLKAFLRWLCNVELISDIRIYKRIKPPRAAKKVLQIYENDEIKTIFASIKATPEWIATRNQLIIALMLDSGLRQSEVATIELDNIDRKRKIIKVYGKGNKERYVPIGQLTYTLLKSYMAVCPYNIKKNIFLNKEGSPITNNTIKLFVHKLQNKSGLKISSHKLRHNFATNYILDQYEAKDTVDIYKLMYLMGHEEMSTTRNYLHLAQQYLACQSNISHLDNVLLSR